MWKKNVKKAQNKPENESSKSLEFCIQWVHYDKPEVLNFVKSGLAQHFQSAGRAGGGECHTNQSGE